MVPLSHTQESAGVSQFEWRGGGESLSGTHLESKDMKIVLKEWLLGSKRKGSQKLKRSLACGQCGCLGKVGCQG